MDPFVQAIIIIVIVVIIIEIVKWYKGLEEIVKIITY